MSRNPTPTKSLPSGVFNLRDDDHSLRTKLDILRKREPDEFPPSRAEMMRRLADRALGESKKVA